jgi:hypothetical protein
MTESTFKRLERINDGGIANNTFEMEDGKMYQPDGSLKKFHWFFVSGNHTHENIDTGVVMDLARGWSTAIEPHADGFYKISCKEDAVVWCFNEVANAEGLPNFDFHHVSEDTTFQFSAGAKWFLIDGQFTLNGVTRSKPRAFTMAEDKLITFDTDSMFIVLKD